jgi:hypothetical protein
MQKSPKTPIRSRKKKQVDYENLEDKGTTNQKKRHLGETLREDTKNHFDIL